MNLPLFYFGNIAYWKSIIQSEKIEISDDFFLPKKSYCNRTIIATANGLQSLSIPIMGGRGIKIKMSEVKISYSENWISKHKMALQSAYSKSPFYEFYMPYFTVILDAQYQNLSELNLAIFKEIYRILKLEIPIEKIEKSTENIVSFFNSHEPNKFDLSLKSYPQVFRYKGDFEPDLSILDLLFCMGNRSLDYLK
jgi:WbqC-like protein family